MLVPLIQYSKTNYKEDSVILIVSEPFKSTLLDSSTMNFLSYKQTPTRFFFQLQLGSVVTFGWPYGTLRGIVGPCSYEIWSLSPQWQLELLHHQKIFRLLICHNYLLWKGNMLCTQMQEFDTILTTVVGSFPLFLNVSFQWIA